MNKDISPVVNVCVCECGWDFMCVCVEYMLRSFAINQLPSIYPMTKKSGVCSRSSVCLFVCLFAFFLCAKDIFKSHNSTSFPLTNYIFDILVQADKEIDFCLSAATQLNSSVQNCQKLKICSRLLIEN